MKRFFTSIFLWITFLSFQNNLFGGEMPRYYQPQAFSYISSIVPTADNGFIILGYFKSLPTDMFRPKVVKFDQRGEFQWERSFNNFPLADFSAVDEGLFYKTPDNGYLIVNTYPSTTNNGRYGLIRKYNSNYDSVYSVFTVLDSIGLDESFLNGWNLSVNKIVPTADGGFAIAGSNLKDCYNKGYVLAIYSNTGHLTWKENTPLTNGCIQFRYDAVIAEKTQTGGFLFGIANRGQVAPNQYNGVYDIVKKNSAGVTVWAKTFVTQYDVSQVANKNVLLTQKELANGNVKFLTLYDIYGGNYTGGTFLQYTLSPSGTILQTDTFSFNLPLANYENLRKIVIDKDENILILGQKSFTKLDKKGRVLWQRQPFDELRIYDSPGTKSHFTCFTETPDGNYILGGNTTQTTNTNNSTGVLFYITGDGKMKTKILYGGVYIDTDNSCSYNNEKTYPNLIVKAEKYNQTFYTITDTAGLYNLPVDTGIYKVSFQLPNAVYWKYCQPYYTANLTSSSPALNIALPVQQRVNCPFMNVEVATPYLRKCFQNTYSVYYCNSGTDTAKNSYITVDFDADLLVNSSTLPWASVNGNQYRFNIGNVPPQTCGSFKVYVTVSCSATDGKTHCVTAHVYPDQSCVAPSNLWDGSNITINGICNGDTAVFKISNIGTGNMISPRRYIVIEGDFLRVMPQNFQLNANDSLVIRVPANGKTVRVQAQQDPNFPYPSLPASVIESCSGNIDSLNLVNQFPQDDGAAFLATSCVQNRNSYDPNEKSAQPVGYLERHVVTHNDEIKYTLHFQNTGTDTAHSVVILDTLSPALDLTTLVMGASSHNYTYAVFGGNILQVNFPGIQLPDSNVNAEGSNGFVSFHVQPRKDVPNGTVATNTAQIYFDFNAAISTNQVCHTIDSIQYRITAVILNKNIIADLRVYPNPFAEKTTIELKSEKILKDIELRVLDITGKLIQKRNAEMRFELDASEFTNGIYLLQLTSGGEIIATAKIVKQ
jgi:uncharacterized repeat protein (TIGR01451 family)